MTEDSERIGVATDAAMEITAAIDRFLELQNERGEQPATAHEERLQEAAHGAEIAAELAAINIRRFLELQEQQLSSLIMRAAAEQGGS